MSFRTRKIIAITLLIVVSVWPLAHRGVVHWLDLSPWKFFGWAMYTTPGKRIRAFPFDGNDRPLQPGRLPAEQRRAVMDAYNDFSLHRIESGVLIEPDDFARVLFESFPDVESITILVQILQVDRKTAMYDQRGDPLRFEYERRDLLGEGS